jgi:hypothetical protein
MQRPVSLSPVHRAENGVVSMNTYASEKQEDRRSRANSPSGMRDAHTILQLRGTHPAMVAQEEWRQRFKQNPRVESQLQLQQMLNRSPRVVAQTKLAQTLSARTTQLQPGLKTRENRTGLPDQLKAGIENLSGMAMDDLHGRYDSPGPEAENSVLAGRIGGQTSVRQLPRSETSGVVQRKILMPAGGYWNNPEIGELKKSPLYQQLDESKFIIVIKEGPEETGVTVTKTHNKAEVDDLLKGTGMKASQVDFIVNVNPKLLKAGGTVIDDSRFYRQLGVSRYSSILKEPTVTPFDPSLHLPGIQIPSSSLTSPDERQRAELDLYRRVPELLELEIMLGPKTKGLFSDFPDIGALGNPMARGILSEPSLGGMSSPAHSTEPTSKLIASAMAFLQSKQGKLGLYTTLLHELGHVFQSIRTPRIFSKGLLEDITPKDIPPVPNHLLELVTNAFNKGIVHDPIWFELLDFKNVMDKWLSPVRDFFNDRKKSDFAALAQMAIDLGDDLASYVQIWVEYDVITNVEHPAALKRGEIIRHTHGVEGTIGGPAAARRARKRLLEPRPDYEAENEQDKGPGASIISELGLTNELSAPDSLKGVQLMMIKNAQKLTQPLLKMLPTYLQYYEQLIKALHEK